jgi:hypothetical protein
MFLSIVECGLYVLMHLYPDRLSDDYANWFVEYPRCFDAMVRVSTMRCKDGSKYSRSPNYLLFWRNFVPINLSNFQATKITSPSFLMLLQYRNMRAALFKKYGFDCSWNTLKAHFGS